LNTLRYADHARQIENKAIVNVDPIAQELSQLREQVKLLQSVLSKYQDGINIIKESILPSAEEEESQKSKELVQRVEHLEKENKNLRNELERSKQQLLQLTSVAVTTADTGPLVCHHLDHNTSAEEDLSPTKPYLPYLHEGVSVSSGGNAGTPKQFGDAFNDVLMSHFNFELSEDTAKLMQELESADFKF